MQFVSESFRNEVKMLLNPLRKESTSNAVRNPVLILNDLYQRQIITKPIYDIRSDPIEPFKYIGVCTVGDVQIEAKGKSKKEAKKNVSENVLRHLLFGNVSNNTENDDNSSRSSNSQLRKECDFYVFIECMSINDGENYDSVKEPKHANSRSQKLDKENFYEDDFTGILWFEDRPSESKKRKNSDTERKNIDNLNCNSKMIQFQCGLEQPALSPPQVSDVESMIWSSESSTDGNVPLITDPDQKDYIACDGDFFDPFSQLRPPSCSSRLKLDKISEIHYSNHNVSESSNESQQSNSEESIKKTKSPFSLLHETSIKKFKLIPRCRIEKTENGFLCTLVISNYIGVGEARTKKEAKVKASLYLLPMLEVDED